MLTRRTLVAATLAAPALVAATSPLRAAAHQPAVPRARRFRLGDVTVSTLLVARRAADNPQSVFGLNVSRETFARVSAENFLSPDRGQFFFTPTLVDTGSARILFDTGLDPTAMTAALAAAGTAPADITHLVLTHMHGDHIGGLMSGDAPTFAAARHVCGNDEFQAWRAAGDGNFNSKVRPLQDRFTFLEDGQDVAGGVTAVAT